MSKKVTLANFYEANDPPPRVVAHRERTLKKMSASSSAAAGRSTNVPLYTPAANQPQSGATSWRCGCAAPREQFSMQRHFNAPRRGRWPAGRAGERRACDTNHRHASNAACRARCAMHRLRPRVQRGRTLAPQMHAHSQEKVGRTIAYMWWLQEIVWQPRCDWLAQTQTNGDSISTQALLPHTRRIAARALVRLR